MKKEEKEIKEPYLVREDKGLKLTDGELELFGDFSSMEKRLVQANLERELLVKAARIKGFEGTPVVIDATAGLGEDSMLLAAAGFKVHLYESNEIIGALLKDAHERALTLPKLCVPAGRMSVHIEDSIFAMKNLDFEPDIVFLDPMFPQREKSASVKKKFQLLQRLERPCSNEDELLEAAIGTHPRKIVIKRPIKGPYLGGKKPDYSLSGNAVRYDCLIFAKGGKDNGN